MQHPFEIYPRFFDFREIAEELEENASVSFIAHHFKVTEKEAEELIAIGELFNRLHELEDKEVTRLAYELSQGFHTAISVGEAVGRVGSRVNALQLTFAKDGFKEFKTAYYPQFEFKQTFVMIPNDNKPEGLEQFDTHEEAIKFAKQYILRMQKEERENGTQGLSASDSTNGEAVSLANSGT